MHLDILTPEEPLFSGTVVSVTLPGTDGSFSILDQHAPLMSNLGKGMIVIDSGKKSFSIERGVVEVLHNRVTVLVQ